MPKTKKTNLILSKAIDIFVQQMNKSTKTIHEYGSDLRLFLSVVGDLEVSKIRIDHLWRFRREQEKKGLSSSTVARRLNALGSFIKWCNKRLESPLLLDLQEVRPKVVQSIPKALSLEKVKALFSCTKTLKEQFILSMLLCGLRAKELLLLEWGDIETDEKEKRALLKVHGKGGKDRVIFVGGFFFYTLF